MHLPLTLADHLYILSPCLEFYQGLGFRLLEGQFSLSLSRSFALLRLVVES